MISVIEALIGSPSKRSDDEEEFVDRAFIEYLSNWTGIVSAHLHRKPFEVDPKFSGMLVSLRHIRDYFISKESKKDFMRFIAEFEKQATELKEKRSGPLELYFDGMVVVARKSTKTYKDLLRTGNEDAK